MKNVDKHIKRTDMTWGIILSPNCLWTLHVLCKINSWKDAFFAVSKCRTFVPCVLLVIAVIAMYCNVSIRLSFMVQYFTKEQGKYSINFSDKIVFKAGNHNVLSLRVNPQVYPICFELFFDNPSEATALVLFDCITSSSKSVVSQGNINLPSRKFLSFLKCNEKMHPRWRNTL